MYIFFNILLFFLVVLHFTTFLSLQPIGKTLTAKSGHIKLQGTVWFQLCDMGQSKEGQDWSRDAVMHFRCFTTKVNKLPKIIKHSLTKYWVGKKGDSGRHWKRTSWRFTPIIYFCPNGNICLTYLKYHSIYLLQHQLLQLHDVLYTLYLTYI